MDSILQIVEATKSFGGLVANSGITFDVPRHSIVGIVGPNGAGKTTLFNSLSGVHPLTSGKVIFDGTDITRAKAYDICAMGMGRTFQIPQSLNEMTVWENVLVACLCKHKMGQARERADQVLAGRDSGSGVDLSRIVPLVDRLYVTGAADRAELEAAVSPLLEGLPAGFLVLEDGAAGQADQAR